MKCRTCNRQTIDTVFRVCHRCLINKMEEICDALPLEIDFRDAADYKDNSQRFNDAMNICKELMNNE